MAVNRGKELLITTLEYASVLPPTLYGAACAVAAPPAPEGYVVTRGNAGDLAVVGADAAGALYGTLRLLVLGPEALLGGKKTDAVVRNTVKHRMRHALMALSDRIHPMYDLVIIARQPALFMSATEMVRSLEHVLTLAELVKK